MKDNVEELKKYFKLLNKDLNNFEDELAILKERLLILKHKTIKISLKLNEKDLKC